MSCLWGRFVGRLNHELMEWRSPGRYGIEPRAAFRTPKFDVAEFKNFRMKPFGITVWATDRASLTVRYAQLVTTTGA